MPESTSCPFPGQVPPSGQERKSLLPRLDPAVGGVSVVQNPVQEAPGRPGARQIPEKGLPVGVRVADEDAQALPVQA